MGRKRRSDPDSDKVSFMLLQELNQQVEDLRARRKWSKSYTLRYLIELGLDAERQQTSPATSQPGAQQDSGQEGRGLLIDLSGELRACIDLAAELHGLDAKSIVQLILVENIEAYIERGRQKRQELRRILGERQQDE
jgi:hypothetical protein